MNEQLEERPLTRTQYALLMAGALFISLVLLSAIIPAFSFIDNAQLVYTSKSF